LSFFFLPRRDQFSRRERHRISSLLWPGNITEDPSPFSPSFQPLISLPFFFLARWTRAVPVFPFPPSVMGNGNQWRVPFPLIPLFFSGSELGATWSCVIPLPPLARNKERNETSATPFPSLRIVVFSLLVFAIGILVFSPLFFPAIGGDPDQFLPYFHLFSFPLQPIARVS